MSRMLQGSDLLTGIIEDIEISKLKQPANPIRSNLDEIEELVNSIRQNGLLQPIVVRVLSSQEYEIVAGTRRCKACKSMGWRKLPCHIVELDDKEAFEVSLVENIQRRSLDIMDEAKAFKNYVTKYGWGGVSDLAKKVGKSPSYITKRIQLLNLPHNIIDMVERSSLKPSVADELSMVVDKTRQSDLAEVISKRQLSLRKARLLLQRENELVSQENLAGKSKQQLKIEKTNRAIDKAIVAMRIAMRRIGSIIENSDSNIVFEILMDHKKLLHDQIDSLMKEKKKIR